MRYIIMQTNGKYEKKYLWDNLNYRNKINYKYQTKNNIP